MTPILINLNSWPVMERNLYRIGTLIVQCVIRLDQHTYVPRGDDRSLADVESRSAHRSDDRGDLVIFWTNTVTFGPWNFLVSGSTFWNGLPLEMRDQNSCISNLRAN